MIPYTKLKEHNRRILRDCLPLKKPFTLIIEPTNICNFKCIQCFQSVVGDNYFNNNKMHMDLDCFSSVIEQMKCWQGPKLKVIKLSLYGEPFFNPNFCEMLKIAKAANIAERIETTTNASLLTKDICKKLIEFGLDYMRVSIYSLEQKKHNKITNSKLDVNVIRKNLLTLKRTKKYYKSDIPFVGVKMLDNYSGENDEFIRKYKNLADEIFFDKPHNWITYNGRDFIRDLYNKDFEKAKKDLVVSASSRIACTLPFFTLAVRSNGDVIPCCIDWIGNTTMGNISKDTLEDVWNGERMFEFRKMQLENRKNENQSCRSCELYLSDYYTRDNIDGFSVEKLRIQKQ